ncbi:MAG: prolipoprotein diacylglyceryl transferase, partial [bacterium]|nr:prolipoprotein diacylglyceryl transferase [bacterium]
GARLFSLIFPDPIGFLKDPLEFFRIWNGGMSFFGGLIGGFAVTYFYVRKHNMDWRKFADIAILPLAFALILGRLANFSNAELLGTPSSLPWCVVFTQVDNICRHPYQLYSGFLHLILFSVMLIIHKTRKLKPGALFFIFLTGYGILRLATGFFRDDPYRLFGLTLWQYGSIALIILGIVYLIKKNRA